jgi:hypothetical protein
MRSDGSHLPFAPLAERELSPQANGAELTRAYCDHAGGRKPLRGWLTLVRSRPRSQCAAAGYAHWWRVHRVPSLARVKDSPV